MPMPEASVDEYDPAELGKYHVRGTRELPDVETVTIAHPVDESADDHFRLGVAMRHRRHDAGSRLAVDEIYHGRTIVMPRTIAYEYRRLCSSVCFA
jgi:hypothetical protein